MFKKNPLIVKTYKLPLIKRVAQNYPYYRALFWLVVVTAIIVPMMAADNWDTIWLLYFIPLEILVVWQIVSAIFTVTYKAKYAMFVEQAKNNP